MPGNFWEYEISQGYGPTDEPLDSPYGGYAHFNKGIDYATPLNTPIRAVVGGRVIAAGPGSEGWGTRVWIQDADGNVHNYGHLNAANVEVGATVAPGTLIGMSGSTGKSTGPHLSYDVWNPKGEYINPSGFLGGAGAPPPPPAQVPPAPPPPTTGGPAMPDPLDELIEAAKKAGGGSTIETPPETGAGAPAVRTDAQGRGYIWSREKQDFVLDPRWDKPPESASGPPPVRYTADGKAMEWNGATWIPNTQWDRAPDKPAGPQGSATKDELTGLKASFSGALARVTNPDGSVDVYERKPDSTYDYTRTEAPKAAPPKTRVQQAAEIAAQAQKNLTTQQPIAAASGAPAETSFAASVPASAPPQVASSMPAGGPATMTSNAGFATRAMPDRTSRAQAERGEVQFLTGPRTPTAPNGTGFYGIRMPAGDGMLTRGADTFATTLALHGLRPSGPGGQLTDEDVARALDLETKRNIAFASGTSPLEYQTAQDAVNRMKSFTVADANMLGQKVPDEDEEVVRFASGGSYTASEDDKPEVSGYEPGRITAGAPEPVIGVGAISQQPLFIAGEEGEEDISFSGTKRPFAAEDGTRWGSRMPTPAMTRMQRFWSDPAVARVSRAAGTAQDWYGAKPSVSRRMAYTPGAIFNMNKAENFARQITGNDSAYGGRATSSIINALMEDEKFWENVPNFAVGYGYIPPSTMRFGGGGSFIANADFAQRRPDAQRPGRDLDLTEKGRRALAVLSA